MNALPLHQTPPRGKSSGSDLRGFRPEDPIWPYIDSAMALGRTLGAAPGPF